MPKVETNLLLEEDAVAAGERYSADRGTTLSSLVSDLLRQLPVAPPEITDPVVRRLYGIAAGGSARGIEDYHNYLARKYGVD